MQNHAERFASRLVIPSLALATGIALVTADFNRFLNLVIVDYGTGIRGGQMERGAAALVANGPVSEVAARFGVVVSDKALASVIPILRAIGDATVNALFTAHVQTIAETHFTLRRLERICGIDMVKHTCAPAARPAIPLAV